MPRKSAAALEVAANNVTRLPERPKCPPAFKRGSAEAKAWDEITSAQAADWFTPGDMPLLEAYCRAIVQYRRVSELIETGNGGLGEPFTITGAQGGLIANPIYAVQDRLAKQMATCAVKLRLSQSTRLTAGAAGTKGRKAQPQSPAKPWQRSEN